MTILPRAAMRKRVVSVIGSGTCDAKTARTAEEVGRRLAKAGAVVVTGGLGGVMRAASRGAKRAGGLVVGVLPTDRARDANEFVDVAIPTGLREARNAIVANCGDAVIAVAGEYGTLSEIAFALRRGTRVYGLGTWEIRGVTAVSSPAEAVRRALARR
jgi:hypothetical protein